MTPKLTNRAALTRFRLRAKSGPTLDFHRMVCAEIQERLTAVNKSFRSVAVVTPHAEIWRTTFPDALIVPDDEVLNLGETSHDLIIHALALHWADDPVGQLVQCRRGLQPDGLFLCAAPGGRTLHELRSVLAEAETKQRGGISPRVAPMAEIRDLGALLQRAGFALPVADSVVTNVTYQSARHLMRDLRAIGETNALAARDSTPLPRAFFDLVDALYARHFSTPEGRVYATLELIYLTGWAPDDSQQKPLRPGSATQRLADALGTKEKAAGDPISRHHD